MGTKPNKDVLRFMTCGSVDDGKSTLVGRLLYDSNSLKQDQLESLIRDSKNSAGSNNSENLDFSLLTDGLQAEQEQGITIDVAYRFFETKKKKFIIADCPGHIHYTRNTATASSHVDLAIILIDVQNGMTEQTARHFFITHLFGIKNFIIVINKMDRVNFSQARFSKIKEDFLNFAKNILDENEINVDFLPASATHGDNIVIPSTKAPYYKGGTLLNLLENTMLEKNILNENLILCIKYVARLHSGFRGFKGKISSGKISVNDKVRIFGKRISSEVKEIFIDGQNTDHAKSGDIVCLRLKDEIDISSGDLLTGFHSTLVHSSYFNADLIWLDHEKLNAKREYLIKFYNNESSTVKLDQNFTYDTHSLKEKKSKDFTLNQIGNFDVEISNNTAITRYKTNRELGSFILIDKISHFTVGAGMIRKLNISSDVLPISKNITYSIIDIKSSDRARMKNQKPLCLWLTGLSGSGKSTVANLLDKMLYQMNKHSFVLDGDNIRHGLNADLGFSREDRTKNVTRIGYTCKLMYDAGLIVISASISPDAVVRDFIRNNIFKNDEFIEIYLKTDLETCKKRDHKNLYKRALEGKIKNFTGIDSPYDIPENPEITIDTKIHSPEKCVSQILNIIAKI